MSMEYRTSSREGESDRELKLGVAGSLPFGNFSAHQQNASELSGLCDVA